MQHEQKGTLNGWQKNCSGRVGSCLVSTTENVTNHLLSFAIFHFAQFEWLFMQLIAAKTQQILRSWRFPPPSRGVQELTAKYAAVKHKPAKIKEKPPNLKTKMRQSWCFDCKTNNHSRPEKFHVEMKSRHPFLAERAETILRKVAF